jgi:hypothetical protein
VDLVGVPEHFREVLGVYPVPRVKDKDQARLSVPAHNLVDSEYQLVVRVEHGAERVL